MATVAAQQLTFLIVGGETDAPGWKLVWDGKEWKIVPVPGWNPELTRELSSLAQIVAKASEVKNAQVSRAILNAAGPLVQKELSGAVGAEHGTVVIVT
jgi:hypothetical protein